MGSTEEQIDDVLALCNEFYDNCNRCRFEDEAPQHQVDVDEFRIGQTEVTNAQWQMFMETGGYQNPDYWTETGWQWRSDVERSEPGCWDDNDYNQPDQPVVEHHLVRGIGLHPLAGGGEWISEARLPSEAEWEKAACGPSTGQLPDDFPWGDEWDGSRLNYCDVNCTINDWKDETVDDGYARTAPVGSYPDGASPYGVSWDMAGNVWEWTSSQRMGYPYEAADGREGLEGGAYRVVRGGVWYFHPSYVRAAARPAVSPADAGADHGVRVVVGAGVPGF